MGLCRAAWGLSGDCVGSGSQLIHGVAVMLHTR